jgi:hypothetical protein
MAKVKKVTKKEKVQLFGMVDNEGFGYYMLDYGPDLKLLERLGFNRNEVEKAIKLLSDIQELIVSFEELSDDEG